jgi:hypothetical protein
MDVNEHERLSNWKDRQVDIVTVITADEKSYTYLLQVDTLVYTKESCLLKDHIYLDALLQIFSHSYNFRRGKCFFPSKYLKILILM